jgi:hypothetical protein
MAITEGDRHRMHQRLEALMGDKEAATLMEHLPPVGWAEVATKADLEHLRAATKADIDQLQAATKADLEHVRAATKVDIEHLRTTTASDIEHLRTVATTEFAHLHTVMAMQFDKTATKVEVGELRAEMHKVLRNHTMFLMGTNIALVGLVAAVFGR